ncbi:hypothetical protein BURPSS13_C0029 [Burkholderia pseudomallei S13]|nr:hypothetical protein BURPSS13_C0029 [Burkholderia pseudomallei S13]
MGQHSDAAPPRRRDVTRWPTCGSPRDHARRSYQHACLARNPLLRNPLFPRIR